jgi:hypothetical protein
MAADDASDSPSMASFVLRLRLGGGEPPSGMISALDGTQVQPFYGWIDLMSAVNRLRGWEDAEPGTSPHPRD